jgi:T4 bacteriophage base plate protein
VLVDLPGGLCKEDGATVTEVELRPLTGREEEWLGSCPADLSTAAVVTELLGRCVTRLGDVEAPGPRGVRELLPADRDYLLLALRAITFGSRFDAVLDCPGCAEKIDVGFSAGDVPVERRPQRAPRHATRVKRGDGTLLQLGFRLPRGSDQEAAARAPDPVAELLRRCVKAEGDDAPEDVLAALDSEAVEQVEQQMEQVAPRLELAMDLVCPDCQHAFAADFEPARFLLQEMRAAPDDLLREVHSLAYHYHWTERDILELTRPRRRRYLSLIGDQLRRQDEE